ncbi:MAG: hypothetical protein JW982_07635 [Spirochaetes bacterium]|nr:hypothetical protein [Spirochaetota bacterium]
MLKILLHAARAFFVAGIAIVATSVFIDSMKVSKLSNYNNQLETVKLQFAEKFDVPKPEKPINEASYLTPPARNTYADGEEGNTLYKNDMEAYNEDYKKLRNEYNENLNKYNKEFSEYTKTKAETDLKKKQEEPAYKKTVAELEKNIKMQNIEINNIRLTTILRYIGAIILLTGTLGMLILGELYERIGVLVMIGISLKSIIGL